ncbi:HAMP domain-containing protein [Actinoplanes sp. LDG1-06]|uniref:histidine kinase n=1 Tax=Paractinoplanes ovalisporus TaxID=2810368 RepID=A0ABS2A6Z0_9ACTN|nr:ATP-binding protein [Actinoplanes ovalisporus]MBM2615607.1 HAMP domain-containing protein [Actinoplanes ovalisporus]
MSFRVRIFVLVMLVAVTAIGATAWLTLNLTSRQVHNTVEAQATHRTEIVQELQRYGRTHGNWPGVDRLVQDLSERTDLHIRIQTAEVGEVLVDSDIQADRASGAVQPISYDIDAYPRLEEVSDRPAPAIPSVYLQKLVYPLPRDIWGPVPTDRIYGSREMLALRQATQFRTGLVLVRCLRDTLGEEPALASDRAPYVTAAQRTRSAACMTKATTRVMTDEGWFMAFWDYVRQCMEFRGNDDPEAGKVNPCTEEAFNDTVSTSSAVPLELYLGGRDKTDVTQLISRTTLLGAAGLVLVALIGTYWIARQVSSPVRRLTGASQMLAAGQLETRVRINGKGELARLASSFNMMAEAVQQSEERQRRLIADVAHEMRTPLSNLRGYLEGLSDGVIEPSKDLFVSLHEETMLQGRILDDLQVLALAEAGDLGYTKAPTDLAELASGSVTAQRAVAAEAGVALTVDASAPVWVEADQDRIRQVLGNLLTNAIRYTDRDGQVLVRVRAEAGEAVLTVQDTGVGIAAGDVPHVFDRFWRADPARQRATGGTGLGLTIAHRIVTDHGGRIGVESRQHVGTTFTVRLPLTAAA